MNRLTLEVVPGPTRRRPAVRILVDGEESLRDGDDGFLADDLLSSGALLPTDPPRRVALYTCACGCPGCGNTTVLISREGDVVLWSAPASVTDEYEDGPLPPEDDPDPLLGSEQEYLRHPLDRPDLAFDAAQYLAEVEAAARALDSATSGPRR